MKTICLTFLLPAIIAVMAQEEHSTHYIAEVYFVVEPQVLRNYEKLGYNNMTAEATLREDIRFFLAEVNKRFSTMAVHNLNMEIRMKRLDILTREVFDEAELSNGNQIKAYVGLAAFKEWLLREQAMDMINYDVAVLWTGYNILSRSGRSSITGYAKSKSACTSKGGVALVQFDGTQTTAYTTAHELAHTLGTSHDKTHSCPPFVGYIMTPTLKITSKRRWQFSVCSVESIKTYIIKMNRYRRNCLLITSVPAVTFDIASQLGRDVMDPQKICARVKNDPNSYFCTIDAFFQGHSPNGDVVCEYLYCGTIGSRRCSSATPTEGMVCNPGKRCDKGKCVAAPPTFPTPPGLDPDCLYGDLRSGTVRGVDGTCEEYLTAKGINECYTYSVTDECCASCAAIKLSLPGCAYGDKFQECLMFTQQQICPNNSEECCFTCRNFRTKRSEIDESIIMPKLVRREEEEYIEEPLRIVH